MVNSSRGLRIIVLAVVLLCLIASLKGAFGAQKNGGDMRFASVDNQRILHEYKVIQDFLQTMRTQRDQLKMEGQVYEQNPFLSPADQKSLGDLTVLASVPAGLTPAQKTAQQALLDKSKIASDEYQKLVNGQTSLTAADKQLLNTYVQMKQDTDTRVNGMSQQFQADLTAKSETMDTQAQVNVKAAIAKVAKEKGYTLVFDSAVAPYAQNDCTDDVLKILNK